MIIYLLQQKVKFENGYIGNETPIGAYKTLAQAERAAHDLRTRLENEHKHITVTYHIEPIFLCN